jgi:hypothetical protein
MTEPAASGGPPPVRDVSPDGQSSVLDALTFLYVRRLRLALRFAVLLALGVAGFVYAFASAPKVVEGTLELTFQGIERHEYPTGRKFSVEDIRGPDVVSRALADSGIDKTVTDLKRVVARIFVTPLVPSEIQARWRKQERDGTRKDEYFPSEFRISIGMAGLSDLQRVRFFDAVIRHYREQVKYAHKSALRLAPGNDYSYEKLVAGYDFWDLPSLFLSAYRTLGADLNNLGLETMRFADLKYNLAFRRIAKDLDIWHNMRLQALEALTYQGRLVKDRDSITQRIQYRIGDIDIQIQQKTQEAEHHARLLALVDRPKALLTGQLANEKGPALMDASAVDRLIKTDYVAPIVARITRLQEDRQSLAAEKARLERQLTWLPKATNVQLGALPAGYKEIAQNVSSELREITTAYNRALDEYLDAVVTSQITVKHSPVVSRDGAPSMMVLGVIVAVSVAGAVVLMSLEHLYARARAQAAADGPPHPSRST